MATPFPYYLSSSSASSSQSTAYIQRTGCKPTASVDTIPRLRTCSHMIQSEDPENSRSKRQVGMLKTLTMPTLRRADRKFAWPPSSLIVSTRHGSPKKQSLVPDRNEGTLRCYNLNSVLATHTASLSQRSASHVSGLNNHERRSRLNCTDVPGCVPRVGTA